jgi:hypothetical protein
MTKIKAKVKHYDEYEQKTLTRYSKKRIKQLEEKSGLSIHTIGKIVFDSRWTSFNLNGEFQNWIQKGNIEEVCEWLRENYCRLNIERPINPRINYE